MDLARIGYRWAFKRGKSDQSYHRPPMTAVTQMRTAFEKLGYGM